MFFLGGGWDAFEGGEGCLLRGGARTRHGGAGTRLVSDFGVPAVELSVAAGGKGGVLLEVFAEEGLGWEVQVDGNLLDTGIAVGQHLLGVADNHVDDPVQGRLPRLFLDDRREVAGRETELVGIEGDLALAPVVLLQGDNEGLEDAFLGVLHLRFYVLVDEVVVEQFVEEGLGQAFHLSLEDVAARGVILHAADILLPLFQQVSHLLDTLLLFGQKGDAGFVAHDEDTLHGDGFLDERQDEVQVALEGNALQVGTPLKDVDEGGWGVEVHVTGMDDVGLFVDADLHPPVLAQEESADGNLGVQLAVGVDVGLHLTDGDLLEGSVDVFHVAKIHKNCPIYATCGQKHTQICAEKYK